MDDSPRPPGTGDDRDMRYEQEPPSGIPRWVKILGLVVLIVALLVVVMILIGGAGPHNPLRHVAERGTVQGYVPWAGVPG